MSIRQLRNRVRKVEETVCPEHDGVITWEEFNYLYELSREDRDKYAEEIQKPRWKKFREAWDAWQRRQLTSSAQPETDPGTGS